ncbi:glucose-1-phosphate adenylyltransferase subunit GlgD [Paenibacillus aceris]|uniref:Glucose-1-phosphate adenylyltransferase n=1 Tax=Paenibacillus aceris TaxID=869555 RepID=A0ABS4I2S6_9BACL|nr:glucose-1-phosphate adenylyltransferase subunit GlgD [Paenibacillus aceris]MBP1964746.1 glucose-1-phosphate adenylyltransferase [Paenibacillus aceris]NHW33732.1 glucose-1-phosphate adenylyltransferase subunit GlgD [Paenibacillus aceris]
MENVLGMINLMNEQDDDLSALTRDRCVGAVPFAGRFRLADFALSNMSHAGIQQVMVLASPKADSLLRHIGSGQHYGLKAVEALTVEHGDLLHLYSRLDYLKSRPEKYVLLAPSSVIYHSHYERMVDYHVNSGTDITVLFKPVSEMDGHAHIGQAYSLELNDQGRVVGANPTFHALPSLASHNIDLDTMVLERDLLIDLILKSMKQGRDIYLKNVIWAQLDLLHVQGYANHGYMAIMDSVDSYYAHSMQLLQPQGWRQFMRHQESVYTRKEDEPAIACHRQALIRNAFVAPGCRIEGCVENSILFPGVTVHSGAHVKNSVIMHECVIEAGAYLDKVILDKQVIVEQGAMICGQYAHPFVAEKSGVL